MSPEIRRHRTLGRPSWPFNLADDALRDCALSLWAEPFDATRSQFAVEEAAGFGTRSLDYELKIVVRPSEIASQCGISTTDLALVLHRYNDDAKRHVELERWQLEHVPTNYKGTLLLGTYGPKSVDLGLAVVLDKPLAPKIGRAWRLGSSVAARRYSIALPTADTLFRVDWTEFSGRGWPPEALWHIVIRHGVEADTATADELVEVHLNSELPALVVLFSASAGRDANLSPAAAMVRSLIGAEVLFDLALGVLGELYRQFEGEEPELAEESLAKRLIETLGERGLSRREAQRLAVESPAELKDHVQAIVGVGRNFSQQIIDRMRRP